MFNLTPLKTYFYIAVFLVFFLSISYAVYEFHYAPINKLNNEKKDLSAIIEKRDAVISAYEKEITSVYQKLYDCEQDSVKNKLDGIIEGIGDDNETVIIDFDNITF